MQQYHSKLELSDVFITAHVSIPFLSRFWHEKFWTLLGYTVARASTSPRNSTRPFFPCERVGSGDKTTQCVHTSKWAWRVRGWSVQFSFICLCVISELCYHAVYAKTRFLLKKKLCRNSAGIRFQDKLLFSNSWVYYYRYKYTVVRVETS